MIKVEYVSDAVNENKAIVRNIGFQMLMRRHHRQCTLRYVSRKIGFPADEIDNVEIGKRNAKMDVLIALIQFYNQKIEETDFRNIKRAYDLN